MDSRRPLGKLDAGEVILSSYLSNFGQALAQAEARKSPLGAALYQTMTGKSPYEQPVPHGGQQPGQPTGPQQPGRYKRPGSPAMPDHVPLDMNPAKQPIPLDPDAGTVDTAVVDGPVPKNNTITINNQPGTPGGGDGGSPNETGNDGGYNPGFYGGFGGGVFSTIGAAPPQSGGEQQGTSTSTITYPGWDEGGDGYGNYGGDGPYNPGGYDNMARGGVAGRSQVARVGESGPEMAGGQIVSKPSIVKLEKGDSVIPLTPRAGNKLQPDLLEGHLATPKPAGMQYSRYKSYGQGRGLMR